MPETVYRQWERRWGRCRLINLTATASLFDLVAGSERDTRKSEE
jgi:hypothetical protein